MTDKFIFRKSNIADLERTMAIIREAQTQMAAAGSDQWQNGYPATGDIMRDMERGYGHVLSLDGEVVAYAAVVFDGEEAYNAIEGAWHTAGEYVVVHRLAVADRIKRRGVGRIMMHRIEKQALSHGIATFRIDTSFDNRPMLALLRGEGFAYCGKIRYASGERLAFDKEIR